MSSHVLSEVERVCDRIALLRRGELVLLSTVEKTRKLAARRVRVFFAQDVNLTTALPPGSEIAAAGPRWWSLNVEGPLGPLLSVLGALPVRDIEVQEPTLEDVIMKYYREDAP